jgi:hypothetical protein
MPDKIHTTPESSDFLHFKMHRMCGTLPLQLDDGLAQSSDKKAWWPTAENALGFYSKVSHTVNTIIIKTHL